MTRCAQEDILYSVKYVIKLCLVALLCFHKEDCVFIRMDHLRIIILYGRQFFLHLNHLL